MPNLTCVVLLPPPISTIWSVLASGADTWNGHNVKPMFHWLSKDSRSRDLSCNLRKSFKHKGENGRVSILLVRARLHPHSLGLSPDWSFISTTSYFAWTSKPANSLGGSCFGGTNQTDLFTISSGSLNSFGPGIGQWGDKLIEQEISTSGPQQLSVLCSLPPLQGV